MKISLNYLKQFLNFDLPEVSELADIIGRRLGALEEPPISLKDIYKDVVIVRVEDCQPIKDTDHLNLCRVNDGGKVQAVDRDNNGFIEVVCGAANVKSGIMAAWLPPESVLPASYFKERLVLSKRPIRGQISNGMLASPKELSLSDEHDGILILDQDLNPGDSFSTVYELDDYIIDIENKMFTHRPDCFGILGVAREVSGILNQPFKSPDWYLIPSDSSPKDSKLDISIKNDIPTQVRRFSVVAVDNIEIKPSPIKVQTYLSRMGIRPINNIVDLTNIIMLETGQPLHGYDYHKLKALTSQEVTLSVRYPKTNEKVKLLNSKELTPTERTICIAVDDHLVGLGGVMGAENTEVDANTKTIVLESASFDMYDIRRTSMELGIFSEAVTRFTKGQSPLQTVRVLDYALKRLRELLPDSVVVSDVVDDNLLDKDVTDRDSLFQAINITPKFISQRLGLDLTAEQITDLLTNVEFKVENQSDKLTISAPFWRTDIEIREDIVEEVGRLYGYENIETTPLLRPALATPKNIDLESKAELRRLLAAAGANELLTYSFISKRLIEDTGQSVDRAFEIANALSPALAFYRLSLTPPLLTKVQMNIKAGYDKFAIFEIGRYHLRGSYSEQDDQRLPSEYSSLALVYASKQSQAEAAFYQARHYLDYLIEALNISGVSFKPLNTAEVKDDLKELAKPFNPSRSALVLFGDKQCGIVGEFSAQTTKNLKLPKYSAGFEVNYQLFLNAKKDENYTSLPKYPPVKQDITLKIPNGPNFADVDNFIRAELNQLVPSTGVYKFELTSIFRAEDAADSTNYSFHLVLSNEQRTLKDEEVNDLLDKLAARAADKFSAVRV